MKMRKSKCIYLLYAAFLLAPLTARADGIDLPLVAILGIGIAVPLLIFNVVVEGFILSKFVHKGFFELCRPMFIANVWSLAAGLPIAILNTMLTETLLPNEMVARMGLYPFAIFIGISNYYIATVIVEFWFLRKRVKSESSHNPTKGLARGLLIGHLASYAVLGPLVFMYVTPKNTVHAFTKNSQWATKPTSTIVYLSPHWNLQTVKTDGSQAKTVLTNEVRDFVVSHDLKTILFRGASNQYFLSSESTILPIETEKFECYGEGMDFSPGGRFAGLIDDEKGLLLWDRHLQRVQKHMLAMHDDYGHFKLVWSTNENEFYMRDRKHVVKATIGIDNTLTTTEVAEPFVDLANHYAHHGERDRWTDDWDASVGRSFTRETNRLTIVRGLGQGLRVHSNGESMDISDNPGIFHFGRRWFTQAAFINDHKEVVFSDTEHIYLAHIASKKVGLLTPGKRFLLFTPPFSKSAQFNE